MEFVSSVLRFEVQPEDLHWRLSNLMGIPNADFLERSGSENLSAGLWRLPPKNGNALHMHMHIRAGKFYFVLESENLIPAFCTS